jgi:pyridinium-3,5-biscarboxylic acid mononucleotide synthase
MRSRRSERRSRKRVVRVGEYARHDIARPRRTGVPEVILGEGKPPEELVGILLALHARRVGALVSRPTAAQQQALRRAARGGLPLRWLAGQRIVQLAGPLGTNGARGVVGLITAGTADIAVAEEARAVLEAVGHRVVTAYDVGVAGLHRTLQAVRTIERQRPRIYLVCAGREGALPTVVAGLVHAPVVGVPTSVGYGRGGRGEAALNAMLQSCAPIAVVNIDGGVPAALFASQMLALRSRNGSGAPG